MDLIQGIGKGSIREAFLCLIVISQKELLKDEQAGRNTCVNKGTGLKKWRSDVIVVISEKVGEVRRAVEKSRYLTYF